MKATKEQINDLDYDELQSIRETACEGCKGDIGFNDSDCRKFCDAFRQAAAERLEGEEKE